MSNAGYIFTPLLWCVLASRVAGAALPLQPTMLDLERYAETFTVIADLADGSYLQLQLAISNLGLGSAKGACRALLVPPVGAPWTAARSWRRSDWSYTATKHPALAIGDCTARAGEQLTVTARLDGRTVQLVLAAPVTPVSPPGNQVGQGDDFYWYEILVPWAPATAELTTPAGTPRRLVGFGYADHSRATMVPADLARRWVRFRGLGAARGLLLLGRQPAGGGPWQSWTWVRGQPGPTGGRGVELVAQPLGDGTRAWVALITAAQQAGGVIALTPLELLYRYAPVEEHGLLGAIVRPLVGSPVTYTYRAVAERVGDSRPIAGIMEVTVVQ